MNLVAEDDFKAMHKKMKGLWNVKMIAFSKRISWNLPADSAVLLCSDLSDMKTETRPQSPEIKSLAEQQQQTFNFQRLKKAFFKLLFWGTSKHF